ncbi:MAG: hypothetical protein VB108_07410 [Anaerolineaceae bacterium]|nr:hypothetical protein [Anaerolineaceae bacterium]
MNTLEIGTINLNGSENWLQVIGKGRHPLLASAKYLRRISGLPEVEEELELFFRGSPAELQSILMTFYGFAEAAEQDQPGLPVLFLRRMAEGEAYFSPVLKLGLEEKLEPFDKLGLGTLGLKLTLRRKNHYESAETELPLTLPGGSSQTGGVLLYNHSDGHNGHHAVAAVNTAGFHSGLPVSLRTELTNPYNGEPLGKVLLGLLVCGVMGYFPKLEFEAEAAGSNTVPSASESGGAYLPFSWSGNQWTTLFSCRISDVDAAILGATALLPLLRLRERPAESGLQFRLRISAEGALLAQTMPVGLGVQGNLLQLPSLRLLQRALPGVELPAEMQIELQVISSAPGAHALEPDALRLLPQSGYLVFTALTGLAYGGKLMDDPIRGRCWGKLAGHELQSHNRFGTELFIPPSQYGRLFLCGEDLSGRAAIERTFLLRVWGRKRRQIL